MSELHYSARSVFAFVCVIFFWFSPVDLTGNIISPPATSDFDGIAKNDAKQKGKKNALNAFSKNPVFK